MSIENSKYFSEDLLVGFHLTFFKDGKLIESLNKELKSPNAVAHYLYTAFDEETESLVVMENDRADVFVDGTSSIKNNFEKIVLEDNLYFTYELLGALVSVNWVSLNEETNDVSFCGGDGYTLSEIARSGVIMQNLSDTRYNNRGEEYEATFDSQVSINFKYIDYLTSVKVLEYDKNNQLIKSSDFIGKNRWETFNVGETCEYVIIEEEYTVMKDDENKGEKHYERTLISKSGSNGLTLKYPRGDGLISPIFLSIQWAEDAA